MTMTMRQRAFRTLLDRRGLLIAPEAHEEKYVFKLEAGPLLVVQHPAKVREALEIAKAVYGDGNDEHGELLGLYAQREALEGPSEEPREIAWLPHAADGPGLNPGSWVRLDEWIADQFLMEEALLLRYEREVG